MKSYASKEVNCLSDCLLKAIETAKQEKYFMTEEYINNALRSLKELKKIDSIDGPTLSKEEVNHE